MHQYALLGPAALLNIAHIQKIMIGKLGRAMSVPGSFPNFRRRDYYPNEPTSLA
jgi:hypothetical protein